MQGATEGPKLEELRKELAAAKMDADSLRAKVSGLRTHSQALEMQLSSARSATTLQDIQAVAGKDKRLVREAERQHICKSHQRMQEASK